MGERLTRLEHLIITDIDNTLMGDDDALEDLLAMLEAHHERIGFGVATGRSLASVKALFERKGLTLPEVLITSVAPKSTTARRRCLTEAGRAHLQMVGP